MMRDWYTLGPLLLTALPLRVVAEFECDQEEWSVSSTSDASSVSAGLPGCEGDTISVSWAGHVVLEEEIQVSGGTSLSISGMGLGAAADGNGSTPLFLVEDGATLNIENMILMNGVRDGTGGAIQVDGAEVHIGGTTVFEGNECSASDNSASGGGAVRASNSVLTWTGNTTFVNNRALTYDGGAINCSYSNCTGNGTALFEANYGNQDAGAVRIEHSNFSCVGTTSFINNLTPNAGGAFFAVDDNNVFFSGTTNAVNNSAASGGAFSISGESTTLTFDGNTVIANNIATQGDGGGIAVGLGCSVSWGGVMAFENNFAQDDGGGLSIDGSSNLTIGGSTLFAGNSAGSKGGAIYANANTEGLIFDGVDFEFNSAAIGGAIASYSTEDSEPNIVRDCTFRSNEAASTGGAIEISVGEDEIHSSVFVDNLAGSGGALRLSGVITMTDLVFQGNMARAVGFDDSNAVAGPAVSNLGTISEMTNMTFIDNTFYCSEGTYVDYIQEDDATSTRYGVVCAECLGAENCSNCTIASDKIPDGCQAAPDGTVAVAGGTVETLEVEPGRFRATNTTTNIFSCYRDTSCLGGFTGDENFCAEGYTGPYCCVCASGYSTTLAFTCSACSGSRRAVVLTFVIFIFVLAVLAAVVGVNYLVATADKESWFFSWWIFSRLHNDRFEKFSSSSFKIVLVVWQIVTQFADVANVTYPDVYDRFLQIFDLVNLDLGFWLSAGCLWTGADFHHRLLVNTLWPLGALAILATTYYGFALKKAKRDNRDNPDDNNTPSSQITQGALGSFQHTPSRSEKVVESAGPKRECRRRGRKESAGGASSAPSVVTSSGRDQADPTRAQGAQAAATADARSGAANDAVSRKALKRVTNVHVSAVLWLTFLVYSTVSSIVFQAFACDKLDDGGDYLRADYRILCTSAKHRAFMVYSGFMILVYPVGILVLYLYLLCQHHYAAEGGDDLPDISDLLEPYQEKCWYWEVIECLRRIMLTGVVVFIFPGDAAQVAVTIVITFAFFVGSEVMGPNRTTADTWLSRIGHVVVMASFYIALLYKVDVSSEREASQNAFGWVLLALHIGLIAMLLGFSIYSWHVAADDEIEKAPPTSDEDEVEACRFA